MGYGDDYYGEPVYKNPLLEGQDGAPVEVDVKNLTDYAGAIFDIYINSLSPTAKAFAHIPTLLTKGLALSSSEVQPLAEGIMANQMMQRRVNDFRAFMSDMNNGIMAIANAAQVVAYCYDDTDGENGATIDQVAFAFADAGSRKPSGFDNRLLANEKVTTMEQQQAEAAAKAGGNAGAYQGLYGNTEGATENRSGNRWEWPDGSYMAATTSGGYVPVGNGGAYSTTTYTIYDKNGKVIGTRVVRTSTDPYSGARTDATEVSNGATTQNTSTTVYRDGHVDTRQDTSTPGPDGKPVTTHTENSTTTERPSDSGNSGVEEGPVETVTDQYGTKGTTEGQQQYGIGY